MSEADKEILYELARKANQFTSVLDGASVQSQVEKDIDAGTVSAITNSSLKDRIEQTLKKQDIPLENNSKQKAIEDEQNKHKVYSKETGKLITKDYDGDGDIDENDAEIQAKQEAKEAEEIRAAVAATASVALGYAGYRAIDENNFRTPLLMKSLVANANETNKQVTSDLVQASNNKAFQEQAKAEGKTTQQVLKELSATTYHYTNENLQKVDKALAASEKENGISAILDGIKSISKEAKDNIAAYWNKMSQNDKVTFMNELTGQTFKNFEEAVAKIKENPEAFVDKAKAGKQSLNNCFEISICKPIFEEGFNAAFLDKMHDKMFGKDINVQATLEKDGVVNVAKKPANNNEVQAQTAEVGSGQQYFSNLEKTALKYAQKPVTEELVTAPKQAEKPVEVKSAVETKAKTEEIAAKPVEKPIIQQPEQKPVEAKTEPQKEVSAASEKEKRALLESTFGKDGIQYEEYLQYQKQAFLRKHINEADTNIDNTTKAGKDGKLDYNEIKTEGLKLSYQNDKTKSGYGFIGADEFRESIAAGQKAVDDVDVTNNKTPANHKYAGNVVASKEDIAKMSKNDEILGNILANVDLEKLKASGVTFANLNLGNNANLAVTTTDPKQKE